ncbi:MAG: hypothetical protein UY21_C0006G0040 [Microgenomates group bacterium GW2011_GWA1_48_10]|uniref:Uncharacterized protein n=1 Tax=Candidatus Gottesmanbacteria bacterium RIFCSPHIGHO2_01_FULL_47_48 TaxID=1798381 RepID=A0A1F6A4J3_9BACT|nr:MAG: hypothetical protein UY21_C0006G0040 [Microgenomates group bacterium GW2011_GWA1_48_10]OGG19424.1 MAG: hypothetical protein A2721_02760 [Candidatus Gottesmanbacteria bacterium RIFCSPHIGHO2_01_FULL_47_48]
MKKSLRIWLIGLIGLIWLAGSTSLFELRVVKADFSAIEVANSYKLADGEAKDGDIVSSTPEGLARAKVANDPHLYGVVTLTPMAAFRTGEPDEVPVSRNGVAMVNVTVLGGEIHKGDFITSSEIAGVGQKAASSGYVLGIALQDFPPSPSASEGQAPQTVSYQGKNYKVGQVRVGMRIEYADINSPKTFKRLFDALGGTFFSSVSDPNKFGMMVRYIAAGLAILAAILFAFLTFSRSIPRALEAIGRNPLARRSIYLSLLFSVLVMLVVIALGVIGAFVMLKI